MTVFILFKKKYSNSKPELVEIFQTEEKAINYKKIMAVGCYDILYITEWKIK